MLQATLAVSRKDYLEVQTVSAESVPKQYEPIAHVASTKQEYEKIKSLSGLGYATARNEGEAHGDDARFKLFDQDVTPVEYGIKVRFTKQMAYTDQYGEKENTLKEMGRSIAHTRNKLFFDMLNNHTSSSYVGPDAKALVATDHVWSSGGTTYSNRLATDQALGEISLTNAYQQFVALKGPRNTPLMQMGTVKLVHGTGLMVTAMKLAQSMHVPGSADNDSNVLSKVIDPMMSNYITSTTAWWIIAADKEKHNLTLLERMPMDTVLTPSEEGDQTAYTYFEVVPTWHDGRGLVGTPGV